MYSVIIVDDEPWAIKGIRNAFNWDQYGFEITGQFTSAHKALEFIGEECPDLVITDIRMPEISGLDLMRKTKDLGLNVDFVVVSGFAEFAYAQEAIRYGALDYCLKPLDIELADPLIEKLALHFSKKQSTRNNLILEALTASDKSELNRLTPFFDQSSDDFFRVVIVANRENQSGQDITFGDRIRSLKVEFGSSKTLYIIKSKTSSDLDIQLDAAMFTGRGLQSVGISSIATNSEHIAKLIKESDLAASQNFLQEEKGIIEYEQKLSKLNPFVDNISSIIKEKKFDEMDNMDSKIKDFFSLHQLGMGEVVFLWNQVVSSLVSTYYEELKDMELDFLNYAELKERFENFESLCSFVNDIFVYMKQLNNQSILESDKHAYFAQMVKYIDNNYQFELYLKDLSVKFLINQVYCCQLFKKVLGKTFSEYVTDLRIKKACELLKNTEMSIEEIASKVGYFDYYYFNKVFKKQCGITPTKFRKS